MKAIVTSIGEATTDLCVWSLERNGFEVVKYQSWTSLAEKLLDIYHDIDDDFVRVDADVIPNRNLTPAVADNLDPEIWWLQFMTFDWYKQDLAHGGVQLVRKAALPALRANVREALPLERPESWLFRVKEFHNPRRCVTNNKVMGLTNYHNDMSRVKEVKQRREQLANYDFELAERIEKL